MENGCGYFSLTFQGGLFEEENFELGDLSNKEPTMLGRVFHIEGTAFIVVHFTFQAFLLV